MKTLPAGLQAHLDSGTTTLAWCWRLARRDGAVLGFTDHDHDLTFDSVIYEAAAGFTASEIKDTLGLAVDNLEVSSALSSQTLDEHDLAAGRYDDAKIEIWRVNWQDVTQRVLMRSGSLGEVRRGGSAFSAEVRGLAHYLNQPKGRLYQYTCDADLGDARCAINLALPAHRAATTVVANSTTRVVLSATLSSHTAGTFTRGLLTMTSGANSGTRIEIRRHTSSATTTTFELWQPLAHPPLPGDTFVVTAGCDKHFDTCRTKFNNAANFRGFPHMPGNDFVASVAHSDDGSHDGSPLR